MIVEQMHRVCSCRIMFIYKPLLFLCGFISDQQMLEECEQQLQAQQQRCDAGEERLDWLVKTLGTIRAGVEHLADKLQHITLVNTPTDILPVNYCRCLSYS